jgi:LysM repeat protein
VRIAIFTIISIHAVFFAGLLMQGCRRDEPPAVIQTADLSTNQNTLPPLDPYYPAAQDVPAPATPVPPAGDGPAVVTDFSFSLPTAVPSDMIEGKSHTVVRGDTLGKIARANGVTVGALSRANPTVDPARLRVGSKLQIPAADPSTAKLALKEPEASPSGATAANVYRVKSGETLSRIAKRHGTTVKAIRAVNNLKSDRLLVGQKLTLPAVGPG